jgi:hypothetical protein
MINYLKLLNLVYFIFVALMLRIIFNINLYYLFFDNLNSNFIFIIN